MRAGSTNSNPGSDPRLPIAWDNEARVTLMSRVRFLRGNLRLEANKTGLADIRVEMNSMPMYSPRSISVEEMLLQTKMDAQMQQQRSTDRKDRHAALMYKIDSL